MPMSGGLERTQTLKRTVSGSGDVSGAVSRYGGFGRQPNGSLGFVGALLRSGKSWFARNVGEGDIDLHGAISRAATQFGRVISATLSFSGALSAVKRTVWLVGTLTWQYVTAAATYYRSIAGTLDLAGALTRLGKFRRRVLSKRILLETGLDLLLEGGGLIFMEGAKVLNFAGSLTRVIGQKAFALAGAIDFAGSVLRWQHISKALSGAITPAGALSRLWRVARWAGGGLSFDAVGLGRKFAHRAIDAAISFAGAVTNAGGYFARVVGGGITFAGKIRRFSGMYFKKGLSRFGFNLKDD